jgi:putative FmdB family regulatory protein
LERSKKSPKEKSPNKKRPQLPQRFRPFLLTDPRLPAEEDWAEGGVLVGREEWGESGGEEDNMPIYEYKCRKCGYKFEELVFEEREIKCPKCGSKFLEKLISLPNIGKKSSNNGDDSCPTCKW